MLDTMDMKMAATETCEEFYDDEVYQAIEVERRVNELCYFCANQEISAADLTVLLEDEVVDHGEIRTIPDDSDWCTEYGLLPVDVYFINGDGMTVYS